MFLELQGNVQCAIIITLAQKSCLAEEVEYSEYEKLFHERFGDSIIFCFTDRKAQIQLDLISLVKTKMCNKKQYLCFVRMDFFVSIFADVL